MADNPSDDRGSIAAGKPTADRRPTRRRAWSPGRRRRLGVTLTAERPVALVQLGPQELLRIGASAGGGGDGRGTSMSPTVSACPRSWRGPRNSVSPLESRRAQRGGAGTQRTRDSHCAIARVGDRAQRGWAAQADRQGGERHQLRMLTAREPTMAMVVSDTRDWAPMISLAVTVRGMVSVGLKAVELVSDT